MEATDLFVHKNKAHTYLYNWVQLLFLLILLPISSPAQSGKDEASSPLELFFEKVEDLKGLKLRFPCYKITARQATIGKLYSLVSHDLGGKITVEGEFVVSEQGELQRPGEEGAYLIALCGFQPGEPVEYLLIAEDRSQHAKHALIPWPIVKANQYGQKLRVEVLSQDYCSFIVHAEGFLPGELLEIRTLLAGKAIKTVGNATAQGFFSFLLLPGMHADQLGGEVSYIIQSEISTLSIKLPWGTEYRKRGEEFIKRNNETYAKQKDILLHMNLRQGAEEARGV